MSKTATEILTHELETLKAELIQKYEELGLKASGNWGQSLEVNVSGTINGIKGVIKADHYTPYIQHGRANGKMPPLKAIEEWINNKGLKPLENNIKISSLAFLIARKIAREGTKRFQQGGKPEFIDAVITPQRIHQIAEKVGYEYMLVFTAEIINIFEQLKK